MCASPPAGRGPWRRVLLAALLALFVVGLVRTAWLSDDAMITLRTVENLLAGHGLRWNVADRVQAFTHPLWLAALTVAVRLGGDPYLPPIVLGIVVSTAALLVLAAGLARTDPRRSAVVVLAAALLSRSFVDYATSGLENPLTNLLLAVFAVLWLDRPTGRDASTARRLTRLSMLAGLAFLNRMDTALLLAPPLLAAAAGLPWPRRVRAWSWAVVSGLLWLAFATFYYASPFPVTAHAKLSWGVIPRAEVLAASLDSLRYLVEHDRVTLLIIAAALATGWRRHRALLAGIALHLGYVAWIGGDFMGGRFFVAPFVVALVIVTDALARVPWRRPARELAAVAVLAAASAGTTPGFLSPPDHHAPVARVGDERGVWYPRHGLLSPQRTPLAATIAAARAHSRSLPRPRIGGALAAGWPGLLAGPDVHLVDLWLLDPLIARLPPFDVETWKPGHLTRRIPEGYWETLATGDNRLRHPGLARYWDDLSLAIRGELCDPDRLAAVWRLLRGTNRDGLAAYVATDYHDPPVATVPAHELTHLPPTGAHWSQPPMRVVYKGGLDVVYSTPVDLAGATLDLAINAGNTFDLTLLRAGDGVATTTVSSSAPPLSGADHVHVEIPEHDGPVDRLRFTHRATLDLVWAVGGIRVRAR